MLLVSDGVHAKPPFGHKFVGTDMQHQKTKFEVDAFGGQGTGRNYWSAIKIGGVDLSDTIVGVLERIKGFGGEMGDGCVSFMKT